MQFQHWGSLHLYILILTFGIGLLLVYAARKRSSRFSEMLARSLGAILLLNSLVYVVYRIVAGYWELRYDLPMEFCNWSLIASVYALYTGNRTMAELSYYWVMAVSFQGILSPDLQVTFPNIYFFIFFINHSGLVIAAIYVVFGMRLYPRRGSVLRTFIISQLYVASAFTVDFLVGGNYGYIMSKPASGSVLDYMGPWPFYILGIEGGALLMFILLYLPFYFRYRWHNGSAVEN